MAFWRIQEPQYDSDYRHTYINGEFDRLHSMPGISCKVCGQTWGDSHVMPFACPAVMRDHPKLLNPWPVDPDEHRSIREQVLRALHGEGQALDADDEESIRGEFMGGQLYLPSRPQADFLWSAIGSLIVSQRVRDLLVGIAPDAIACAAAPIARLHARDAELEPPIPSSGEPEDLVTELAEMPVPETAGPYFELAVVHESGSPPGADVLSHCAACGRVEIDRDQRELRMEESMWRGDEIFLLATTMWVVVTDAIKVALTDLQSTNVRFTSLDAV